MQRITLILFLLFTGNSSFTQTETYSQIREEIKRQLYRYRTQPEVSKDSIRTYLLNQFENKVYPHWVGTKWAYEGHTNTPGTDKEIACGYFVSTTLKHMHFQWNRYELAKMYSLNIVEKTCQDLKTYTDKTNLIKKVLSAPDNLYIIGLDSHVGFILKTNKMVWFVHSNYYGAQGPIKELASVSPALNDSQTYYLGTFFTDKNIGKWLQGETFTFN